MSDQEQSIVVDPVIPSNVIAYTVKPTGNLMVVIPDLAPLMSEHGVLELPPQAAATVDEYMRKGTVVAVGPDCKISKSGDRIIYAFDSAIEIEKHHRRSRSYAKKLTKVFVKEDAILAFIEPCDLKPLIAGDAVVHCLKPEEQNAIRAVFVSQVEEAMKKKPLGPSKIIDPFAR
jgi:hypothetical protein